MPNGLNESIIFSTIKTKILHIISSLNRGGRERQLSTIYKYSDKSRLSTKVVCFNKTTSSYIEEYGMSVDVIYLSSKNFFKRVIEIRRIIKENNTDIIWTWGGFEATFGLLLSVTSSVKHINGSIRHGIVRFNKHQLWRMVVLHLSKHIVANSNAGLRANKLKRGFVIYNGIDDKFFTQKDKKPYLIRTEFGIDDDTIILTSIANLVPYKDYNTILKALSAVKLSGIPFHYIAIGEGSERKNINKLIQTFNLNENVSFPGSRTDIKEILYTSDIFIHSSLGEGCSNAILEAMAAGLPIIATDTGGTNEIVNETNGGLFEFQNTEQLANILREMICNKSKRELMAENSKRRAQTEFSTDRMMYNYYNIIEGLIK